MAKHTHEGVDEITGIATFFHCNNCLGDLPQGESLMGWARLAAGITPAGEIRVWCNRCDLSVVTLSLSDAAKEMLMNFFQTNGWCSACSAGDVSV